MLSRVIAFFISWLNGDHNVVNHSSVGGDVLLNPHVVQVIAFGEDSEKGELQRGRVGTLVQPRH